MTIATPRMNTLLLAWMAAIGTCSGAIALIMNTLITLKHARRNSLEEKVSKLQTEFLTGQRDLGIAQIEIAALKGQMERMTATHAQSVKTYEDTVINLQTERVGLIKVIDEQRVEIELLKGMQ